MDAQRSPQLTSEDVLVLVRPFIHGDLSLVQTAMSTDTYSSIYTYVYHACTQRTPNNRSAELYDAVCNELDSAAAAISLVNVEGVGPAWAAWSLRIGRIGWCLQYLNRFYVRRLALPTIQEVAARAFARALVHTMQPARLLNGEPMQNSRIQAIDRHARQQASSLSERELREALNAHGRQSEQATASKSTLVERVVAAEVECKCSRRLHPLISALSSQPVMGARRGDAIEIIDVKWLIVTDVVEQSERISGLLSRLRRHALQVGRFACVLQLLFATVHYRPGGAGANSAIARNVARVKSLG